VQLVGRVVGVVQRALRGVQYLPCLPCLKIQTWATRFTCSPDLRHPPGS
jgi:hypothetical protein